MLAGNKLTPSICFALPQDSANFISCAYTLAIPFSSNRSAPAHHDATQPGPACPYPTAKDTPPDDKDRGPRSPVRCAPAHSLNMLADAETADAHAAVRALWPVKATTSMFIAFMSIERRLRSGRCLSTKMTPRSRQILPTSATGCKVPITLGPWFIITGLRYREHRPSDFARWINPASSNRTNVASAP